MAIYADLAAKRLIYAENTLTWYGLRWIYAEKRAIARTKRE